ncbi:twin-arginine translocation pathway signal [Vibrio maritimus]|uniref:Twin-arginine translocation pathway signal n=1 Tax=Vibrio maritimus TaxID=990268 RepID=A0A090T3I0_9VIBR|nr:twin-arginine translocation pathway signal [Vibrio maritimus]
MQDSLPPVEVIRVLQKADLNIDLATFIAHALPMRESIWWATLATGIRKADLSQIENKVIEDSANWVKQPNEALRRDIEKSIQPLANESSAKWVGQAVFWSGHGSIAPVENPVVMPADFLHAKAVAGAVNTAAALPEWSGYIGYYKQVINMALDIADGGSGKLSQEAL